MMMMILAEATGKRRQRGKHTAELEKKKEKNAAERRQSTHEATMWTTPITGQHFPIVSGLKTAIEEGNFEPPAPSSRFPSLPTLGENECPPSCVGLSALRAVLLIQWTEDGPVERPSPLPFPGRDSSGF